MSNPNIYNPIPDPEIIEKISTLNTLINTINPDKISMMIVHPKFFPEMIKEGIYQKQEIINGLTINSQKWHNVYVVFMPYVEDWYIMPRAKWYEQPFEGLEKVYTSTEL